MHTIYTINQLGMQELTEFIRNHHKDGEILCNSPSSLNAWASEAEENLDNGSDPSIEMKWYETKSGHTEIFTISSDGFDTQYDPD